MCVDVARNDNEVVSDGRRSEKGNVQLCGVFASGPQVPNHRHRMTWKRRWSGLKGRRLILIKKRLTIFHDNTRRYSIHLDIAAYRSGAMYAILGNCKDELNQASSVTRQSGILRNMA